MTKPFGGQQAAGVPPGGSSSVPSSPSPGRIVLVFLEGIEAPAIVQSVNPDGTLQVSIFRGAAVLYKRSVPAQPEGPDHQALVDFHWRWPTRV